MGEALALVSLATDASSYRWRAMVGMGGAGAKVEADFWGPGDERPIYLKEADALPATQESVREAIKGHRVDAYGLHPEADIYSCYKVECGALYPLYTLKEQPSQCTLKVTHVVKCMVRRECLATGGVAVQATFCGPDGDRC